ncbi:purine-nucleoside phosphorylase [Tuberibacillus sp. Marseille-P3662]|uniref:purine-nucleoside phosphorylase n=1 Tax=Tuberibacillus sp. Marseille-P3662 TaxID=1965358 RepID=UPI000A1C8257|nr:purine-nucleoside phosphorylase [Tuberibacillus sp. Marseille-P3662]
MAIKTYVQEALEVLQEKVTITPDIGLILGSGLGVMAEQLEDAETIPYTELSHFPEPTVAGHAGQFVFGHLNGVPVVAMQGRYHYYEGYTLTQVTFPIRVLHELGINQLVITNAAGGVNTGFDPGDLMLMTDHINWMNDNPLIGPNDEKLGVRFPELAEAYDKDLQQLAKAASASAGIDLREGVYIAVTGPSYETPAEVKMIRKLGGDAVGMSTVPEVIVAKHAGMKVLGLSCISNMAAGILDQPLSHSEVIETTERVKTDFQALIKAIVQRMGDK